MAKITEDLLMAEDIESMEGFLKEISERFKMRKMIIYAPINFNGTRIEQDD